MEPDFSLAIGTAGRDRPALPDPDLLPSRRAARTSIREALARARGPVALTGEPGAGKTTLWRGLEAEREAGESWLAIEMTPGLGARDLYRLIAHGLRIKPDWFGRPELLEWLAARSLDGERWTLMIDEAQNLEAATLEEVRVLSNRLGEADGFAAILLVGQTPLARWLAGVGGRALAMRLAGHVHLRPLDANEVESLLNALAPGRDWPEDVVDRIHRDTRGLPGLVADRAEPRTIAEKPVKTTPIPAPPQSAPLIGPAKPPIRVEDGLIEVGWSSEADDLPEVAAAAGNEAGEQRIDDPYTALQAWHEWATNQGRHPEIADAAIAETLPQDFETPAAPSGTRVWADEEHGFAPFGRLFTRHAQEYEAE